MNFESSSTYTRWTGVIILKKFNHSNNNHPNRYGYTNTQINAPREKYDDPS